MASPCSATWLAAVLALAIGPSPGAAQEKPSDTLLTVQHFMNYETVEEPRLSPDGARIIYTRRRVDALKDKFESDLWIMNADGSRNRFLAKGDDARWSPDGTRVAYVAEADPKGAQIFVRYVDAEGVSTQVTRVEQPLQDIHWAPDGQSIGFVMFVPKPQPWKIDMPEPPKDAKWTPAPRIVQELHYRQDRKGFLEPGALQLFTVPADGGTPRQVTTGDWGVGARFDMLTQGVTWDWTPDGRTIVLDGYDDAKADVKNYRNSHILAVDVATGRTRRITSQEGRWVDPAVSPDGRQVAFAGFAETRASYQARDLYVIGLDGSGRRKLATGLDRDPEDLVWAPDGSGVYFTARDRGSMNLLFAPVSGGMRPVTSGTQMIFLGAVAKKGIASVVRSAPDAPPDVYRVDLRRPGKPVQLTRVNDDILERMRLGKVEELWAGSGAGTRVQGWLVKPPGFDPGRKYPLIMEIHGGPHAMYDVGFNYMFQNFAADGFVVLYANPRGSTGYGSAFGNAIERAYPGVDYDDLMAVVDTVVSRSYVDASRMYVGGCSGGGVLSTWVIAHTTRFAAAAVRCPVTDWISMAGTTDIPFFTHQWFDAPFWERPEPWLRQSPVMYVGKISTPTVVMTGDLDLRTPMPQSEELYAALRMRGVPAALIRFDGEYHGTGRSKPSNFMRTQLYMMSWYRRWGGDSTKVNAAVRP
jgi:dipeptidyl aminopeptidase/acylaminoacyl peptidase